jgi:hypothetical protein
MPLWDSVHRGLEKASHEAARMAKVQRLRSISDGLAHQIQVQNEMLLHKTMELFIGSQLTQPELVVICQELVQLQQQLNQALAELRQLQANAPQSSSPQEGSISSLPPTPAQIAPYQTGQQGVMDTIVAPPPPDYPAYLDSTEAVNVPPPPPDVAPVSNEDMQANTANDAAGLCCPVCHSAIEPQHAFCQQCGAPIQSNFPVQQATVRGDRFSVPGTESEEQATVRAQESPLPTPPQPSLPAEEPGYGQ